jgi:tRNA A-37 threonylcarbamoyl transferase component Bud32
MYSRKRENDFLNLLAPYALKSVHSNKAYRIPLNNGFGFVKVYGPKKPRLLYEIRSMLNRTGIRQPIEYLSPQKRKICEENFLKHWHKNGFCVPDVLISAFPEYEDIPHITTTFVEGSTLKTILREGFSSSKDALENLFTDISERHKLAFKAKDNFLFHIDANTQNILRVKNMFYHVDFEMGRPWETPMECAVREISKFLVSMGEDLKSEERTPAYALFKKYYANHDVLDFLDRSVNQRSFQKLHRRRDEKKKLKNPHRVTLYDITDYFNRY